jgi:hypothetical protein
VDATATSDRAKEQVQEKTQVAQEKAKEEQVKESGQAALVSGS